MKKILFFGALLHAMVTTAQTDLQDKRIIEKGTWNILGDFSLGFDNNESEDEDSSSSNDFNSVNFRSAIGNAVSDNLIVGLGLGYGRRSQNLDFAADDGSSNNTDNITNTYSIFPYARKFFGLNKNLTFFVQGEVRYDRSENEQEISNGAQFNRDFERDALFVGIRPGLTFFVSKNFAIETNLGSLGYSRFSSESNNGDSITSSDGDSFNLNLNPSDLFFGLSYYF
ncbi:MAG: hypothetical protein AAGC45_07740 [Bacteroidota bacterium]